jgi:hypothetical protein
MIATLGGPQSASINTSVQTALDGSFSYAVPTGPDRTLGFSYTAYSDDPGPSATSTAEIMIRPRIRLRIGPYRSSNGYTVHWTGTIAGGVHHAPADMYVIRLRRCGGKLQYTHAVIVAAKSSIASRTTGAYDVACAGPNSHGVSRTEPEGEPPNETVTAPDAPSDAEVRQALQEAREREAAK